MGSSRIHSVPVETKAAADPPQLTPFVSQTVRPVRGFYDGNFAGPRDPQAYLDKWKDQNGID